MKKEYTCPEINVVSLVVTDTTNDIPLGDYDDNRLSAGSIFGELFN